MTLADQARASEGHWASACPQRGQGGGVGASGGGGGSNYSCYKVRSASSLIGSSPLTRIHLRSAASVRSSLLFTSYRLTFPDPTPADLASERRGSLLERLSKCRLDRRVCQSRTRTRAWLTRSRQGSWARTRREADRLERLGLARRTVHALLSSNVSLRMSFDRCSAVVVSPLPAIRLQLASCPVKHCRLECLVAYKNSLATVGNVTRHSTHPARTTRER